MRSIARVVLPFLAVLALVSGTRAQDINIVYPIGLIEKRIAKDSFSIADVRGSRGQGDRTSRATLVFSGDTVMKVKFASSAPNGEAFNNSPRHEVAAYEIQKLFLDEPDFAVPPTILRVFDLDWYKTIKPDVSATFRNTSSVLAVVQYWLDAVTPEGVFDLKRFDRDTAYARHLGNLNLLTHLIRHNDANAGNILVSTSPENPRMFAVDNGLSFDTQESNRGTEWRELRVPRVPRYTVERLKKLTRADLDNALGVLAEFEIRDGKLIPVERGANMDAGRGVRRKENRVQFGLSRLELNGVWRRLESLQKRAENGNLKTF